MKQPSDLFTPDMFGAVFAETPPLANQSKSSSNVDRLRWWDAPARAEMRADPVWKGVYEHLKTAVAAGRFVGSEVRSTRLAVRLPARSASEDSQEHGERSDLLGKSIPNRLSAEFVMFEKGTCA
ncbi:hypothetical protein NX784_10595 [Massilia pinisoli]|uniref:Uncharacterized protein n=1 Tax=Massilia pinisoli TaxID=1772194 RepID=A0ABT1ZQ73_9BURK|nr:hypothetical protein [Massilia pinisoli]MCS0582039.1 hypothetical protein [Massilia pinisoli]